MKKNKGDFRLLLKSMATEWKWLIRYLRKYRYAVVMYALIGVFATVMGLGSGVASKYLIDSVVERNASTLVVSALLVVGLAFSQTLISAITSRIATVAGTRIRNEIRSTVYTHIIRSRWEDINKFHSGDLINRLEGDVGAVSSSVVSYLPSIFTRTVQFFGCLAIVLYYDPTMVIFALMSAPFVFLSSKFTAKMMRKYNKESREMNGKILSYSSESIQNIQSIKAFDLTKRYIENFRVLIDEHRNMKLAHEKFSIILNLSMSLIGLIVSYSCYGWAVWRLWQGAITYGTMTMFLQLSGILTSSFSSLVALGPTAISIATAAGRLKQIADLPTEEDKDAEKAEKMAEYARRFGVSIKAENVTYTYDGAEHAVLQEIGFEASAGETIAFVGPSGEGKTTILRLILGLVKADSGMLTMSTDDGNVLSVSDSTRRMCSYVPQGNTIFSGSIADNLRIVSPDSDDRGIIEALKIADAWEFVSELPEGINTQIGERGVNFSEGQIQRISIARAVLCNAPVLIMDEATSALDADTEDRVLKNIMSSDNKRTCIITTHRPSMLRYCDRIYHLNDNGHLELDRNNKE